MHPALAWLEMKSHTRVWETSQEMLHVDILYTKWLSDRRGQFRGLLATAEVKQIVQMQ